MEDYYVSIEQALKLVPTFDGNKRELLTFISNVDTAFDAVHPDKRDRLFQFVVTKLSGEPRLAIIHRNLDNWEEVKTYLKNAYTERRTLDYHAKELFQAKQARGESVTAWIQRIQKLSSEFREAALQDALDNEIDGMLKLSEKLRDIRFVQGLFSDRIQTIVRSRNHATFDRIAELALEEESAILSKGEKSSTVDSRPNRIEKCLECGRLGHKADRCFRKKENRVNQVSLGQKNDNMRKEITCFNCGMKRSRNKRL
ncbi:hypothetical protein C0J52_08311 [Blattella germanica]|nr:hypothetical protein C0J52_08311 [Blattella germanica]